MKIIGLLFGLYLGSIMSVQAQDLSKDATSIITDSRTEVLCKSMTQSIEKESRTILILNRKGLNAAHFVCECDMFRSLQKFSGEILNASGQSVRKIKKSELQKSEYSSPKSKTITIPTGSIIIENIVAFLIPKRLQYMKNCISSDTAKSCYPDRYITFHEAFGNNYSLRSKHFLILKP